MDTIKNYLETMFMKLPNTEEVIRAKAELLMMMEDKYNELIAEGKAENEAIAVVISEFGNLDEIAESLGFAKEEVNTQIQDRRHVSYDEAFSYVTDFVMSKFMLALGIAFCIVSPAHIVMAEGLDALSIVGIIPKIASGIGLLMLFLSVAVGVGLIIMSGARIKKWEFLKKELCIIDVNTAEDLAEEQTAGKFNKNVMLAAGIGLCIISVAPAAVLDTISNNGFLNEGVAPALLFVMVGIGVFLIIFSGARDNACKTLLSLNERTASVDDNKQNNVKEVKLEINIDDHKSKKKKKIDTGNPVMDTVLSNYWQIVTCIFIIGGFMFGQWGRIWIIWFIAPVVHSFLKRVY